MKSLAHASLPDPITEVASFSGSSIPLDALSEVLESFVPQVEVVFRHKASKNRPLFL